MDGSPARLAVESTINGRGCAALIGRRTAHGATSYADYVTRGASHRILFGGNQFNAI